MGLCVIFDALAYSRGNTNCIPMCSKFSIYSDICSVAYISAYKYIDGLWQITRLVFLIVLGLKWLELTHLGVWMQCLHYGQSYCRGQPIYVPFVLILTAKTPRGNNWGRSNIVCFLLYYIRIMIYCSLQISYRANLFLYESDRTDDKIIYHMPYSQEGTWYVIRCATDEAQPNIGRHKKYRVHKMRAAIKYEL